MQAESGAAAAAAAANGAAGCGGSSPRCLPSWCCLGRGGFDQSSLLFPVLRRLLSACREHTHGRELREPRGDAPSQSGYYFERSRLKKKKKTCTQNQYRTL